MNMMAYNGMKSHPPLRRQVPNRNVPVISDMQDDLPDEDPYNHKSHPIEMPSTLDLPSGILLPVSFVSVPAKEDNHVTLRQQVVRGTMSAEQQNSTAKTWHHKAIRRNLSKAKELVLFVGKLPENLPASRYVTYATQCTKVEKSSIGPVFPALGCFFVTFSSGTTASTADKLFRVNRFQGRQPELMLLPYINMPANAQTRETSPLLVFINCKSGGGQGSQLYDLLMETLNPYQIFLMEKGGAAPGLYSFRKLPHFRILVCGGDGTVGWVLSHVEEVRKHLTCQNPAIAVLPVGTGNDLARVLGFGSSWGGESVAGVLSQIQDTQPVEMDRWNILFDSHEYQSELLDGPSSEDRPLLLSDAVSFDSMETESDPGPATAAKQDKKQPVNLVMSMGGHVSVGSHVNGHGPSKVQRSSTPNLMLGLVPVLNPLREGEAPDSTPGTVVWTKRSSEEEENAANSPGETEDLISFTDVSLLESSPPPHHHHHQNTTTGAEQESDGFAASVDGSGDADVLSSSGSVTRRKSKLASSTRHRRLVHILSQSDLEVAPGSEEEITEVRVPEEREDPLWEEKLSRLRLNAANAEAPDVPATAEVLHHAPNVADEDFTSLDGETNDSVADLPSQSTLRHYSVVSDSVVSSKYPHNDSIRERSRRKKFSLPAIPSFQQPIEEAPIEEMPKGVKMIAMNNYLGIGIDAELSLAFHLAREENPERCTSRFRNKALYFKAGLKKMTSRSVNLNNVIDLIVDDVTIKLPTIKGLIFLNIGSWGAGGNAWGSSSSSRFATPSMGDGMLEVIGVSGVPHMSQIYSGLRSGIRIAQGEYIRLNLKAEVAVQVDGEPWMQPPGKIIITVASTQATMLKKVKKKAK